MIKYILAIIFILFSFNCIIAADSQPNYTIEELESRLGGVFVKVTNSKPQFSTDDAMYSLDGTNWTDLSSTQYQQIESTGLLLSINHPFGTYTFYYKGANMTATTPDDDYYWWYTASQAFTHTYGSVFNSTTSLSTNQAYDAILIDQYVNTEKPSLKVRQIFSNYFRFDGSQNDFTFYFKYKLKEIVGDARLFFSLYFYSEKDGQYISWTNISGSTSDHVDIMYDTQASPDWKPIRKLRELDNWGWGGGNVIDIVNNPVNNIKWARMTAFLWYGDKEGEADIEFMGVREGNHAETEFEDNYSISKTHVNGLGKAIQTVSSEGGGKYIASENLYDELGRAVGGTQTVRYSGTTKDLSLKENLVADGFTLGAAIPATSDVKTMNANSDNYPYAMQTFYDDPLSRPKKSSAPGEPWKIDGKNIEMAYATNTSAIAVDGYSYAANELYKETIKDEDGIITESYTDKNGNVVKTIVNKTSGSGNDKNITTYNVYDERNNLVKTISPKSQKTYFQYDQMNRLTVKSSPDYSADGDNTFDEQYEPDFEFVYDRLGRLRLWRDPAHYNGKTYAGVTYKWLYNKFDKLGRPVESGLYNSSADRATIQSNLDSESIIYEQRVYNEDFSREQHPYTSQSYPLTQEDCYTYSFSYYDDYNFDYSSDESDDVDIPAGLGYSKNRLTASFSRVNIFDLWLWNIREIYFYDKYGRVGEYRVRYPDSQVGEKVFKYTYDIAGNVINSSYQEGHADELYYWYEYDIPGRLHKVYVSVYPTMPSTPEVTYNYNSQGQVESTTLGNNAQKVDYTYNSRGWIKGINETLETGDEFSMLFGYEQAGSMGASQFTAKFNGNITWVEWQIPEIDEISQNPPEYYKHGYLYDYDDINQLKKANYGKNSNSVWNLSTKNYELGNVTYDKHGNITWLDRYNNQGAYMDAIDYLYSVNAPNQLEFLEDNAGDDSSTPLDAVYSEYDYDINGNLITDSGKNITGINYDHRNLPVEIQFSNGDKINFKYDASGNRYYKGTTEGLKEFYVRDPSGREVAIYDHEGKLIMYNLYGLDLIGKAN